MLQFLISFNQCLNLGMPKGMNVCYALPEQPLKEKWILLQKGESSKKHRSIHRNMQDAIHSKYQRNDILRTMHMN